MKVAILHEDQYGWVYYDSLNKEVMVSHPNRAVRNTVRHYLNNARPFMFPSSNNLEELGNRIAVEVVPTDNQGYLELALSEMFSNTGVRVDWGKGEDADLDKPEDIDPNSDSNKPIVKSVDGQASYKLVDWRDTHEE